MSTGHRPSSAFRRSQTPAQSSLAGIEANSGGGQSATTLMKSYVTRGGCWGRQWRRCAAGNAADYAGLQNAQARNCPRTRQQALPRPSQRVVKFARRDHQWPTRIRHRRDRKNNRKRFFAGRDSLKRSRLTRRRKLPESSPGFTSTSILKEVVRVTAFRCNHHRNRPGRPVFGGAIFGRGHGRRHY